MEKMNVYMNTQECNTDTKQRKGFGFIRLDEAERTLKSELNDSFNSQFFRLIIDKYLIVTIVEEGIEYLSLDELEICKNILKLNCDLDTNGINEIGYNGSFLIKRIRLTKDTFLVYEMADSHKPLPAFVRNIIYYSKINEKSENICETEQYELLGITIITENKNVCRYLENAIFREHQLANIKSSNFANSSSYMGSKKRLLGFIIESMFPHCKDDAIFLDIMCGSGAVSNALAQMGRVYASDAQEFCRLLAKIQGAGFSEKRARCLLREMYDNYNNNLIELKKEWKNELAKEEAVFHMDLEQKEQVLVEYQTFIHSFQLYSSTDECASKLRDRIIEFKENPKKTPYCLFTYYFANIYFGLAQCIQLDSLRYAVDQIVDEDERNWALGVLVVVTSVVGTTYGGHFAQPKRVDLNSLEQILSQREKSAWLEFSKRLVAIAKESEKYSFRVDTLKGPWKTALDSFKVIEDNQMVVYVDAPYKREEFSRYYHVLETMVKYDYPSSENKGRLRSKKNGERFSTEFFTKTAAKIEDIFETIINEILNKKAICAWSYSDNGAASIISIVEKIKKQRNCEVFFYAIPHKHFKQGKSNNQGRRIKSVVEYCIVFSVNSMNDIGG